MMDRNAIHAQIAALSEKISRLNELLSKEGILHPVEVDLLSNYERELRSAVEELAGRKGELKVVKQETPEKGYSIPDEKSMTAEPVKLENVEIALHQHILEKMEMKDDSLLLEHSEPKEKTPGHPVPEPVKGVSKLESVEEIVVKKKPPVAAQGKEAKSLSLNERLRKETTPLSDRLKAARKKSIKELFELNERYKIIEELFGGSADQFNKTMSDLSKMAGIRSEAERYLENIRVKYSWEKKQTLADRFADQVLEFLG